MGRRGIALVLVSGLLTLLAAVAAQMALASRATRDASGVRVLSARAGLLARSGVEFSLARLTRSVATPRPATIANRADDLTYRDDPATVPLERAHNPSYARGEPYAEGGTPDGRFVPGGADGFAAAHDLDGDGRHTGFSGRLRGTSQPWGDTFSLKIEDESSKININGGLLDDRDRDADGIPDHRDADPGPNGWNFQLARVLDNLGAEPEVSAPGLGQAVLANRPRGGYASVREMGRALGFARDLSPYLTVSSWVDRGVIRPNARRSEGSHIVPSDLKAWRGPPILEEGGRPPVHLNAVPLPVLAALLKDLSAPESWGIYQFGGTLWIGSPGHRNAAARIVARRATDPFDSWGELEAVCWEMTGSSPVLFQRTHDLIPANFDPNARLTKQVPDQLMWRRVDKSDLFVWSTEGSLDPTGTFRIASLGRVREGTGRGPAASTRCDLTAEVFRPLRQTTQADFVAGRTPDASPESYTSLADPLWRTHGASASWNGWEPGRGMGVATYPCPMTALPANASTVDGAVALATMETGPEPFQGRALTFLHRFDDAWDAEPDVCGAPARIGRPQASARLQTDLSKGAWPDAATEPNTLYPDGIHTQRDRGVSFAAAGNLPSFGGDPAGNAMAVSWWIKAPAYDHLGLTSNVLNQFMIVRGASPTSPHPDAQTMFFAHCGDRWGFIVENSHVGNDSLHELIGYYAPGSTYTPGLRWCLVTASIDTSTGAPRGEDGTLVPDRALQVVYRVARHRGAETLRYHYPTDDGLDPYLAEDVSSAGVNGTPAFLTIGFDSFYGGGSTDAVLDEVAVVDLGHGAEGRARGDELHAARLRDGRYYKGDDGAFLSSTIVPAGGSPARLVSARWTAYLPSEPRPEWPDNTETGGPDVLSWRLRQVHPELRNARVDVELVDDATPPGMIRPLAQGGPVALSRGAFRYRVRFKTNLSDPLNQGARETPWFDDITFHWQPATGPRMLAWTAGGI